MIVEAGAVVLVALGVIVALRWRRVLHAERLEEDFHAGRVRGELLKATMQAVWFYRAMAVLGTASFLVVAGFALSMASQAADEMSCSQWVNCADPDALPPMAKGLLALVLVLLLYPLGGHLGVFWAKAWPKRPSGSEVKPKET